MNKALAFVGLQPPSVDNQVENKGKGYSFKICDMQRLQRFIVFGCESNIYSATDENLGENVHCVKRLLDSNRYKEVLDLIEKYSVGHRVIKEDPILHVLAICAVYKDPVVKKAAYEKVNSICNIPTKLFRFIKLTHDDILDQRRAKAKEIEDLQRAKKRKHINDEFSTMNISSGKIQTPVESIDGPDLPKKKKRNVPTERKSLGWGRMRRNGVSKFYATKDPCDLLYLITKYKRRHTWSHKKALMYAHPKMKDDKKDGKNLVLKYCTRGYKKVAKDIANNPALGQNNREVVDYINLINNVSNLSPKKAGDEEKLIKHLKASTVGSSKKKRIEREHIPTGFLKSRSVWEALLLVDMPITALMRNLGKMSSLNVFENRESRDIVVNALNNAKVHPIKILITLQIYSEGEGEEGKFTWKVDDKIVEALNTAFYNSFRSKNGESFKTNKKYLLGLDVNDSMRFAKCSGCPTLTPAMASITMAMVTWNIEGDENVDIMAFGSTFQDMKPMLKKGMPIHDAVEASFESISKGQTDCALPMVYALNNKKEVDVFIVYTDSNTNCGSMQPMAALKMYNADMGREAKLIVCAMNSNGFSIADPDYTNALDIDGFDANVPEVIRSFVNGDLSRKCEVCEGCKTTVKLEQ